MILRTDADPDNLARSQDFGVNFDIIHDHLELEGDQSSASSQLLQLATQCASVEESLRPNFKVYKL